MSAIAHPSVMGLMCRLSIGRTGSDTDALRNQTDRSTSESGPMGASRPLSHVCNRRLSVFGIYSVSGNSLERPRGL